MNDDHTASRSVSALERDGYEFGTETIRRKALEEIVELTYQEDGDGAGVRIRELARFLHGIEPVAAGEWRLDVHPAGANVVRRRAAMLALSSFPLLGDVDLTKAEDLEQAVSDLVCDLLHLVASGGGWPLSVINRARRHYAEEERDGRAPGEDFPAA